jgi:hypothetical protein
MYIYSVLDVYSVCRDHRRAGRRESIMEWCFDSQLLYMIFHRNTGSLI